MNQQQKDAIIKALQSYGIDSREKFDALMDAFASYIDGEAAHDLCEHGATPAEASTMIDFRCKYGDVHG